jgi:hypothetical protein
MYVCPHYRKVTRIHHVHHHRFCTAVVGVSKKPRGKGEDKKSPTQKAAPAE